MHIQNPVIFTNIYEYSELWDISNPTHEMEFLAKIVKNYNYFSKAVYLRSLTMFWIHLSLNKYSLTCRVTLHYVLCDKYSKPCLLSKIQTYSGIFTFYSDIFSHPVRYLEPCLTLGYSEPCHIQNPGIFRTLSRYILAYLECCVTLAYWEPCHIQDFVIFRIWAYLGPQAYSESSFRDIQAYSDIFNSSYNNINFFFYRAYFLTKFNKVFVFLITMTSISMLDWVYWNHAQSLKIALSQNK